MDNDLEMARHVVYVHQNRESHALGFAPLEASVLRYLIRVFLVIILCSFNVSFASIVLSVTKCTFFC